jgi:type IV pilus assembly protein PilM
MEGTLLGAFSFGSKSSAIGLDIGTDHVRVAQLKPSGSSLVLTGYDWVDVPIGSVVDGEIVDPEAVSGALKELWRKSGVSGKDVAIGVSNQKVVVRLIDLPYMERAELAGAIQYQAQDYIPIPVEDAILDFQIIGDYMTPADEHMMEVLLVAAQRDMVGNAVAAVEGAGLRPNLVDVTSFAIVRALLGDAPNVVPDDVDESGQATGIVHMSAGITNIAVVERGVPRFTRVSSLAGNEFTQAVSNVLNLTFDEAERLKVWVGLPDLKGASEAPPEGVDPATAQAVREALEREANKFIAEVRRSLDYYLTQTSQVRTIKTILLTGSGAQLRNLAAYLEVGLQAQVLLADPLARIQVTPKTQGLVEADRYGSVAAVGLAMGVLQT